MEIINFLIIKQEEEHELDQYDLQTCTLCTYETNYLFAMDHHIQRKHLLTPQSFNCLSSTTTSVLSQGDADQNHKCCKCGSGSNSLLLTIHHALKCGIDKTRTKRRGRLARICYSDWYYCKHCCYKSKWRMNYERHVGFQHEKDKISIKWFPCDHCDYKTKYKSDIKTHIRVNHTEEPLAKWFNCSQCAYKSKRKGDLIVHIKFKHGGEIKWFHCEHCEFKSKWKNDLNYHSVVKHMDPSKVDWFRCEKCGYRTIKKTYYRKHVNKKCGKRKKTSSTK